ncbi:MAG: hypothetical protein JSW55_00540 [Chloroflexota bacterium]|nr:MAG: hypothetical protein JSW55_00540 [Chloroflexota bacterium]
MTLPLKLVRETPRRAGRLIGVLITGPPSGLSAFGAWLHALIWSLFDLSGGPEFSQLFWRLATETRPLAPEETETATTVLGPGAIRYDDVRIAQGGLLRLAFGLNNNRAFATWYTINMPDKRDIDLTMLVHELTHTRQYERVGSVYIGQGLWVQSRLGRQAYDYGGPDGLRQDRAAGKRYSDYNREQQGQIAQDYCARAQDGRDTSAYEPFIDELQQGLL